MKMSIFVVLLLAPGVILSACAAAPTTPLSASLPATSTSGAVTRITADQLAKMLAGPKDFTLVNVHVHYEGDLLKTNISIPDSISCRT